MFKVLVKLIYLDLYPAKDFSAKSFFPHAHYK